MCRVRGQRLIPILLILIPLIYFLHDLPDFTINLRNFIAGDIVDFTGFNNNNTEASTPIIPNIIHFFKFRNHNLTFTELICVLAALCHQKPDRILIHCDCEDLDGFYWSKIKHLSRIEVREMREPRAVFGRPLSSVYHAGDVARLVVLSKYGGIALDLDSYVVQSLDNFRRFEFTVGWAVGEFIGCQVLIAHKNSRFLKMWLDSYKMYRPERWYYNAGELPTQILQDSPDLIHRVPDKFGTNIDTDILYKTTWNQWKNYYAIHTLVRHRSYRDEQSRIKNFDENNIKNYPYTFGQMARLVLYGTSDLIPVNSTLSTNLGCVPKPQLD